MTTVALRREWSMPSASTFEIAPFGELVEREIADSPGLWVDPYSGGARLADVTNDLNPDVDADHHLDAVEFLGRFEDGSVNGGVLFDPPYSTRQIAECYGSIGLETTQETTQSRFWSEAKDEIRRVCAPGATVVSFGWNSVGAGKTRGFEKRGVLLVCHGGWHNDTICVVERAGDEVGE